MSAADCRHPLSQFVTTNTRGAALLSITHTVFSHAGSLGCKLLKNLKARLEDVEDDLGDTSVASLITASLAKRSPDPIVPSLPSPQG